MLRKELVFVAGLISIFTLCSWGRKKTSGIANVVNEQNKCFRAIWVHKPAISGASQEIQIIVKGKKFRIGDNFIYDGKILYDIDERNKEVRIYKGFTGLPPWNMPSSVSPFGKPQKIKEVMLAGRNSEVYEICGKYEGAEVYLTYWIDKQEKVLLKKEHVIGPQNDPLVCEFYECKSIEFNPVIGEDIFTCKVPSDYVRINMRRVSSELLNNKF